MLSSPRLALCSILLGCSGPAPSLLEPGVSLDLAEYRRSRIADVRYELALDVTRRDTATGQVAITFERRGAGDVILDFRGPRLIGGTVNGTKLAEHPGDTIEYNGAHIRIPAKLVRRGLNRLTFDFAARIAPSGASIIRVHDAGDKVDYLYTLLVPADANQLFPCFDQPDLKARVSLSLTVPSGWSAVSNGALVSTDSTRRDRRTLRFAESEPISTYLIGFAAGPWTQVTKTVDGRTMTMYVRASRAAEVDGDSLMTATARAVNWFENYFGVPFPFSKMDFVLVPSFPFSGMEHPGAVFYSEERFVFREKPTPLQLLNREAVIYHEIAHQWFGDLVTMQWFDDLWLKEGFATYAAAMLQAAHRPESDAWKRFYLRNKPDAYGVDLSEGTVSVWQPLANLDQAKSNYGPIVYSKAPGILKQLHYVVGDSAFRAGLRTFLTKHSYANATWRDLLDAVGQAAQRSLKDWGEQYILRPGMPVLEQSLTVENGRVTGVTLRQRPARSLSGPEAWPVQTEVLIGGANGVQRQIPVRMDRQEIEVPLPTDMGVPVFIFANANDRAYAAVALDTLSTRWLAEHVGGIDDALMRAMGWETLWDLVRDGQFAPEQYLGLVARELPREQDEQIVSVLLSHAVRATTAYLSCVQQATWRPQLARELSRMMADPARAYAIRKAGLQSYIAIADGPDLTQAIDALLDHPIAGLPLEAPVRWSIVTKLLEVDAPTADRRLTEERRRDSTADGRRRAFVAEAARPAAAVKRAYFTRYFADSTLNEEWVAASLPAFNAVSARELTQPYLRPALDTLPWLQRNRRIFFLSAWLNAFASGQVDASARKIAHDYLAAHPDLPVDLRRKVLQAIDELERTVAIRERFRVEDAGRCGKPLELRAVQVAK